MTQRLEDQPEEEADFAFVEGAESAIEAAQWAVGDKNEDLMGGGDIIRPALVAGLVDRLSIVIAPVVLGARNR